MLLLNIEQVISLAADVYKPAGCVKQSTPWSYATYPSTLLAQTYLSEYLG